MPTFARLILFLIRINWPASAYKDGNANWIVREVSSEITLCPLNDLLPSTFKDWLIRSTETWIDNPLIPMHSQLLPPAALVMKVHVSPLLTPAGTETLPPKSFHSQKLDEVRLALTCIGPCAPIPSVTWFQFLNPDVEAAVFHRHMITRHIEFMPFSLHNDIQITDPETANIIQAVLAQLEGFQGRLHIALDRLNRSMRRLRVGDKSLDLAIAVETLFTDNSPGENTYKVALRAGLLDPDGQNSRMHTRAIIKALYGIRSAVVHNGETLRDMSVTGSGRRPPGEIVSEAIGIVAKLIRVIARRGSLPDWNTFELGT